MLRARQIMDACLGDDKKLGSKLSKFRALDDRKFQCLLCKRCLSSKQRILQHLHSQHGMTPVKRLKKKYLDDKTIPVPLRTLNRWKKNQPNAKKSLNSLLDHSIDNDTSCEGVCLIKQSCEGQNYISDQQLVTVSTNLPNSVEKEIVLVDNSLPSPSVSAHQSNIIHKSTFAENCNEKNKNLSSESEFKDVDAISELSDIDFMRKDSEYKVEESESSVNCSSDSESISDEFMSEYSTDSFVTDSDSNSSCSTCSTDQYLLDDNLSLSSEDDEAQSDPMSKNSINMTKQESQALTVLSCFIRNNLSASACKDILNTMKQLFPNSEAVPVLDFGHILSYVDTAPILEVHYCILCCQIFPDDKDIFRCNTENCGGLRYKGPLTFQQQKGRQPRQCFVMADVKKQLESLLLTPGIWNDLEECKAHINKRKYDAVDTITDITDGKGYRKLICEKGFLDPNSHNLTAVFNTDGLNLYVSSKVELWPIFLVINELSPGSRFARDNMLLVGIWQGKGKPPFKQYLKVFSDQMNELYQTGVDVKFASGVTYNVKLAILCGIADLPAKAEILNMTYFNGAESCISCEEPGRVVKQGKGSARCFPYRLPNDRFQTRNHQEVQVQMQSATKTKRHKGFKGASSLLQLESYDIVKGTVPDYMHGVLLGVTKSLLNKWFSSTESQKRHFLGKNIKEISRRLQNIKPPDSIERLPRNLEKHYNHFKATELQSWLLYYAIPCLHGFLEEKYLVNLMCLSEAIYILLSNKITPTFLDRAGHLLNQFYSTFQELYGDGACGLNVHNVGLHLIEYVKLWGPLWAWSCFPFEDANAMLLQAVHGTGTVLKQVMKYRQAQACIRCKGLSKQKSSAWKISFEAINCSVSGALKNFKADDIPAETLIKLGVESVADLKKVDRISLNGIKFYASQYSRMQKRICHIVLYEEHKIGSIHNFALFVKDKTVYAIIQQINKVHDHPFSKLPGGKHLISVRHSVGIDVIHVQKLVCPLVYIDTKSHPNGEVFVVRMPNPHGHAVFK